MDNLLVCIIRAMMRIICEERKRIGKEHLKDITSDAFFAMNLEDYELRVEGEAVKGGDNRWYECNLQDFTRIEPVYRGFINETLNDQCGNAMIRNSFPLESSAGMSNYVLMKKVFLLTFLMETIVSGSTLKNHIESCIEKTKQCIKDKSESYVEQVKCGKEIAEIDKKIEQLDAAVLEAEKIIEDLDASKKSIMSKKEREKDKLEREKYKQLCADYKQLNSQRRKLSSQETSLSKKIEQFEEDLNVLSVNYPKCLGMDRFYNKYWLFDYFGPSNIYGSGKVFIERHHSSSFPSTEWSYFDKVEEIDTLISALNCKGIRERALKKSLEKSMEIIKVVMTRDREIPIPRRRKRKNEEQEEGYVNYWEEEK